MRKTKDIWQFSAIGSGIIYFETESEKNMLVCLNDQTQYGMTFRLTKKRVPIDHVCIDKLGYTIAC